MRKISDCRSFSDFKTFTDYHLVTAIKFTLLYPTKAETQTRKPGYVTYVLFAIAEKAQRNSNAGSNPGSNHPGSDPGSNPSSNPGSDPGLNPGSDPGSKFRYPRPRFLLFLLIENNNIEHFCMN